MNLDDLRTVRLPNVTYTGIKPDTSSDKTVTIKMVFRFEQDSKDRWILACSAKLPKTAESTRQTASKILSNRTVDDIKSETMTVDEYCQGPAFSQLLTSLSEEVLGKLVNIKNMKAEDLASHRTVGKYVSGKKDTGIDTLKLFKTSMTLAFGLGSRLDDVPEGFRVSEPKNYVRDEEITTTTLRALAEGHPAVALIGPTGSGKSLTAGYIGSMLNRKGIAVLRVDGNEVTEKDRLFDRDDFNADGTFLLKGTLTSFAEETKRLGLKGLVILEEYNTFSDTTRRCFYRLFNDTDRYHPIESVKTALTERKIDFSHIQFLMTGNPLADRYLADDMRPFSNAESRRIVMLYVDYSTNPTIIKNILRACIEGLPVYQKLLEARKEDSSLPDISSIIDYDIGYKMFTELIDKDKDGISLPYDYGYQAVARWLYTLATCGYSPKAWTQTTMDYLITPVRDITTRKTVRDRIEKMFNQKLPDALLTQGL